MPRTCSVCGSSKRAEIEAAIACGESFRNAAERFGVSDSAIRRHKAGCGAPEVAAAVEKRGLDVASKFLDAIGDSVDQLGEISREARADKTWEIAMKALRERTGIALSAMELLDGGQKSSPESSDEGLNVAILPPETAAESNDASQANGSSSETQPSSRDSRDP